MIAGLLAVLASALGTLVAWCCVAINKPDPGKRPRPGDGNDRI